VSITQIVAAEQGNRMSLQDHSIRYANKATQQHKGHNSYARQGSKNLLTGSHAYTSEQKAGQDDMQHFENSIDMGTEVVSAGNTQQPANLRMLSC